VTARLGFQRYFVLMHLTVQGKLALKISEQKIKGSYGGAEGVRKEPKKCDVLFE
jgi:hypothetical protein